MQNKVDDLQEYWWGLEPLRVFWMEDRCWILADDMIDILNCHKGHFLKRGTPASDRAMLFGDFLGQAIGEAGLPVVTLESAVIQVARMTTPKTRHVTRWLLTEVLPSVYRKHECHLEGFRSITVKCNVECRKCGKK